MPDIIIKPSYKNGRVIDVTSLFMDVIGIVEDAWLDTFNTQCDSVIPDIDRPFDFLARDIAPSIRVTLRLATTPDRLKLATALRDAFERKLERWYDRQIRSQTPPDWSSHDVQIELYHGCGSFTDESGNVVATWP